jgi:hypothetical protein
MKPYAPNDTAHNF